MSVASRSFEIETEGNADVIDVSDRVTAAVRASGAEGGTAVAFVRGSTAAVTTMEYEPGGVHDLRTLLDRLAPPTPPDGGEYEHNRLNHDSNSHAHQRASLIGPSVSIPVLEGSLALGTWQQVVLIDFDDRPRHRTLVVQIIG